MIANFIFFGLNVQNSTLWLIVGVVFLVAGIYVFLKVKAFKKEVRWKNAHKKRCEQFKLLGYSNYTGERLFTSWPIPLIRILVTENSKKAKDEFTLSSSHVFDFNGEDLLRIKEITTGIMEIKIKNDYELVIRKTPGIYFVQIETPIMKYIFHHLNNKYAWIGQEALIELNVINDDELVCTLPYKTSNHTSLALLLATVDGINGQYIIEQMKSELSYFIIAKENTITWDSLIPALKTVFSMYFPKGIKLSGNLVEK